MQYNTIEEAFENENASPDFAIRQLAQARKDATELRKAANELQLKPEKALLDAELEGKHLVEKALLDAELEAKRLVEKALLDAELEAKRLVEKALLDAELEARRLVEKALLDAELEAKRLVENVKKEMKLELEVKRAADLADAQLAKLDKQGPTRFDVWLQERIDLTMMTTASCRGTRLI